MGNRAQSGPTMMTGAVTLALALSALMLLGGHLGRFHGLGDSLAVFRVPLSFVVLAVAAAAFWMGAKAASGAGAVVALVSLATVAPHWMPPAGRAEASAASVSIYQKNLWFRLHDPAEIVADIEASGADIVTLQEVGPKTTPVLEALRARYPVQIVCPSSRVGAVAVLSRYPERPGGRDCREGTGMLSTVLVTPHGPLRAASVHLHWPWPHGQSPQVVELAKRMRAWTEPAVIGGDFNMVRWSHALREIGRASGSAPVGRARVTLRAKRMLLNLSIDHVLATGGEGSTHVRPRAGSDHNGILATVALRPAVALR